MYSQEQRIVTVKDLGIRVGDLVMVTGWKGSGVNRRIPPYWLDGMDDTVGKTYTVARINSQSSILLKSGNIFIWNYHPAWVKLADRYSTIRKQLLTI